VRKGNEYTSNSIYGGGGCGAYEVEPEEGNDEPATVSEGVWRVFTDVSGSQCERGIAEKAGCRLPD